MSKAYLLAAINMESGDLIGYDVFSERNPTTMGGVMFAEVISTEGDSYGEALGSLVRWIEHYGKIYPEWLDVVKRTSRINFP